MNSKVTNVVNNVKAVVSENSPSILTGIGIAGMIGTTVLAVKATPKALQIIESERLYRDEKGIEEDVNKKDIFKLTWKCYIPSVVSGTVSIVCLIGANSVNARRNAALATAYKLSEEALSIYKEKVVETIGEKKEQTIRDKVAKERIEKDPVSKKEIIITGTGNTLCYDSIGRYFESDIETIRKAVNEINRTLTYDMYASLNDFYGAIGLSPTKQGDKLGWNLDDGLVSIDFSSQIAEDGRPCIVIDYNLAPKYDYSKLC